MVRGVSLVDAGEQYPRSGLPVSMTRRIVNLQVVLVDLLAASYGTGSVKELDRDLPDDIAMDSKFEFVADQRIDAGLAGSADSKVEAGVVTA